MIKEKEKIMKDYIKKVKNKYLELKSRFRRTTSVHNVNVRTITKSILYKGGENILSVPNTGIFKN